MSDAIRDVSRLQARQLETLKRKHEREAKSIENAHQSIKAELKSTHAQELVDIQHEHHNHISQEAEKKEKVLGELKANLHNTQELTDKQLRSLKKMSANERATIEEKLSQERQRLAENNELYLEELNHRFQTQTKKINVDGKNQVEEMTNSMRERYSNDEAYYNKKINDQVNGFSERFKKEVAEQERIKDQTEYQFKKQRVTTNQRQQIEMGKLTDQHNQFIETRDQEFRKGLKEQDQFFEKKFAVNLKSHNEQLQKLDDLHSKVLDKMKSGLSKELVKASSRSDDPFYQFEELRPKMSQYPDRVEIKVEVPEHSKEDLGLTLNNKEAIVTFNRRYSDSHKSPDGTLNKINKVETFTSRLATEAFLDPKSVKSSFEDGVMTYVIKKA